MASAAKHTGGTPPSGRAQSKGATKNEGRTRKRTARANRKNGSKPQGGRARPADDGFLSNLVIDHALEMATKVAARAVFIAADLLPQMRLLDASKLPFDIYIVASAADQVVPPDASACRLLKVPSIPVGRVGKIKVAMVMAASRNLLSVGDRVVCVSGLPQAGMLDTIIVMQVGTETEVMTTSEIGGFTRQVKAGVFDTVLELALELANEGREGKPVGTIFVIGEPKALGQHVRQMVLNPFKGYAEKERQILDPAVRNTIKEFSTIDGAFIINRRGVVQSAGTYLEPRAVPADLPPGLGARHHAAASITAAVPGAIAIAVSESTGEVRVFRHGVAVADIEPGAYLPPSGEAEGSSS